jgi:hypothetical protein
MFRTTMNWLPMLAFVAFVMAPAQGSFIVIGEFISDGGNMILPAAETIRIDSTNVSSILDRDSLFGLEGVAPMSGTDTRAPLSPSDNLSTLVELDLQSLSESSPFDSVDFLDFELENAPTKNGSLGTNDLVSNDTWNTIQAQADPLTTIASGKLFEEPATARWNSTIELADSPQTDSMFSISDGLLADTQITVADFSGTWIDLVDTGKFTSLSLWQTTVNDVIDSTWTPALNVLQVSNELPNLEILKPLTLRVAESSPTPWYPDEPTPIPAPIANRAALTTATGREVVRQVLQDIHEEVAGDRVSSKQLERK